MNNLEFILTCLIKKSLDNEIISFFTDEWKPIYNKIKKDHEKALMNAKEAPMSPKHLIRSNNLINYLKNVKHVISFIGNKKYNY
jgi:hypothetical protein